MSRSLIFSFLGGALFALLLFVLYFSFFATERTFPSVSDGKYVGTITWSDQRGEAFPHSFLFERTGLRFSFLFPPPLAEELSGGLMEAEGSDDSLAPLQLQSQKGHFLFFASSPSLASDITRGEVLELKSGRSGEWSLEPFLATAMAEDVDLKATSLQLSLLAEEAYVTSRLDAYQMEMQHIITTTEALEEKLSQGELLRTEGAERLKQAEKARNALRSLREQEMKKLGTYAKQLQLARNATKYGEVLHLSRQVEQLEESLFVADEDLFNPEVHQNE